MLRQQIPGPGERISSGLVAGEKQGETFVAQLLVAHERRSALRNGFFILRAEEHGEQIAAVFTALHAPPRAG